MLACHSPLLSQGYILDGTRKSRQKINVLLSWTTFNSVPMIMALLDLFQVFASLLITLLLFLMIF